MLEEPMILGGQDRVDDDGWHLGEPQRTILLARSVSGAREHLALQGDGADLLTVTNDARDPLARQLEVKRGTPRYAFALLTSADDVPRGSGAAELAGGSGLGANFRVSEPGKRGCQHSRAPRAGRGTAAALSRRPPSCGWPRRART